MKQGLFIGMCCLLALGSQGQQKYLFIGTYTENAQQGIHVLKFDENTAETKEVSVTPSVNPSYLAISPDNKFLYAVNENGGGNGAVSAYQFNSSNGTLTFINSRPSGGDHPCHVVLDKSGRWLVVSNYSGGNFSIYPVDKDGAIGAAVQVVQHKGTGANKNRQEKAHVHSAAFSPDGKYLLIMDLGIDKIMIYNFNKVTGKVSSAKQAFESVLPGSGPRHFTFSPGNKFAYLVEELSGTVTVYAYHEGRLTRLQSISSLPPGATIMNHDAGSADIHISPDGNFLYASNRGTANNIAIYAVDKQSGNIKSIGFQPVLGKAPRNFNFDPSAKYLLVTNQNTNEVVIFERDMHTGMLSDTGKRIKVFKPVCLKWLN